MPTLPTLTVTQAQLDRLVAVFGDAPSYKEWLRTELVKYVTEKEAEAIRAQAQADIEAKRGQVATDLSTAT